MSYKTKAYRKTADGYQIVKRDYICALDKTQQRIFIDTNKPFYIEPDDDGPKLTFNTRQKTFRYYPQYDGRYFGTNEESATHKYCIEQIAGLKELTIIAKENFANRKKGDTIRFSFNYGFDEIVLPIGRSYVKPDLLLYIREPYDLALRWNRLLAVEIVVSHDLNGGKLELMQNAKIPVLRIKANRKWGRKKEDQMSEAEKR